MNKAYRHAITEAFGFDSYDAYDAFMQGVIADIGRVAATGGEDDVLTLAVYKVRRDNPEFTTQYDAAQLALRSAESSLPLTGLM